MGIYTLATKFHVTLNSTLYRNCGFRVICIVVVVPHVVQNIMHSGSLWRSDNSLSYSLCLLNTEINESNVQFRRQDKFNLKVDGICTDICRQTPSKYEVLEFYVVTVPVKL